MNMLDEVVAETMALAEMQSQEANIPTAVNNVEAETIINGEACCDRQLRWRPSGKWSIDVKNTFLLSKTLRG